MSNVIVVDVTALMQGVWDARDDKKISQVFSKRIWIAVCEVAYRGKTGRRVCDYDRLLVALSTIKPDHWIELVRLWEYLPPSLSSAISVGQK